LPDHLDIVNVITEILFSACFEYYVDLMV